MEEAIESISNETILDTNEDEELRSELEMIYRMGVGANIPSLAATYAQILYINTQCTERSDNSLFLAYASIDIACKICDFEVDRVYLNLTACEFQQGFTISEQALIEIQSKILKSIDWQLDFMPVTMLYLQIRASLNYVYFNEKHLAILEGLHFDSRIKDIKYFKNGVFDPFVIAISLFSNEIIIEFLNENDIFIDFNEIEIAREFIGDIIFDEFESDDDKASLD